MIKLLFEVLFGHLLSIGVTVFFSAGMYFTVRMISQRKFGGRSFCWNQDFPRVVFLCYLLCLLILVWQPTGQLFSGSFVFSSTLFLFLQGKLLIGSWIMAMWIGYFLLFLPLGFLLPHVSENVDGKTIFPTVVGIVFLVEFVQPIVGRSFDVDDVMFGTLGALCGFLLFQITRKIGTALPPYSLFCKEG